MVAMFVNGSELNEQSLQRTFQGCFLPSFGSFGKAISEQRIFQKSTNRKQELSVAAMFVNGSDLNEQSLQRTFQGCFLPNFDSFGQAVSEKIFQKSTNQKQELSVVAMFVNGSGRNEQSIEDMIQMLPTKFRFIWPSGFRGEDLKKLTFRNKNCLWRPCLLMDRDKMSNLQRTFYRCFLPSFTSVG